MDRPKLDDVFMGFTFLLARRSECKRSSIYAHNGAVIVSQDNRSILGLGYNGRIPGRNDCAGDSAGIGQCGCIHAEMNALINFRREPGCSIYITTAPCYNCAAAILNAGIDRVYFHLLYRDMSGIELLQKENVWIYQKSREDILPTLWNSYQRVKENSGS